MSRDDQVRRLARRLRRLVPPVLPVRLYLRDRVVDSNGKRCAGSAAMAGAGPRWTHFVVEVERGDLEVMERVLIHEWAHCLSWEEGELADKPHGRLFQIARRRILAALRRRAA